MMKNLIILGDSLSCPRPWEGVGTADTYAYIVQRELRGSIYVQNLAYSDRCTADYITDSFTKTYIQSANADYVVIQLGIVDCAPRLLTTFERAIGFIGRKSKFTNALFNKYIRWKSKHRLFFTKFFPLTRVQLTAYENNIETIIKNFSASNVVNDFYFINIAYPGSFLTEKSFGILENIEKYNAALKRVSLQCSSKVQIIDLFSATKLNPSWIASADGHHILKAAHLWIADEILCKLEIKDE